MRYGHTWTRLVCRVNGHLFPLKGSMCPRCGHPNATDGDLPRFVILATLVTVAMTLVFLLFS